MLQQLNAIKDHTETMTDGRSVVGGRIHYLDIAKGILIILLVFAHFKSAMAKMPFENEYFIFVHGWTNVFICFYMPAFFLISGYCSNFDKGFSKFITSVAKTLFLPVNHQSTVLSCRR